MILFNKLFVQLVSEVIDNVYLEEIMYKSANELLVKQYKKYKGEKRLDYDDGDIFKLCSQSNVVTQPGLFTQSLNIVRSLAVNTKEHMNCE